MRLIDRCAVGILAAASLLMLAYPVTSSTLPVMGSHVATGYDVVASNDMEWVSEQLRIATKEFDALRPAGVPRPELPSSMRWGALIKLSIALAFTSAAVVAFGLFYSDLIVHVGCWLGLAASFAAMIHILMFNADMHGFMHVQVAQIAEATRSDPLRGLGQHARELMSGGFDFQPAYGLYVVTGAYVLALVLASTRVLSLVSHTMERRSAPKEPVREDHWPKSS